MRSTEGTTMSSPGSSAGTFVGRAVELADLRESLADAAAGSTRTHLVGGEPGIGKTRILVELSRTANGALPLWGRCHEGPGAPAFWPWTQVVEGYIRRHGAAALGTLAESGIQNLAHLTGGAARPLDAVDGLDPEQARFALFVAVTRFLARASATEPLLVLIDDIHWADEPSLLLLEFVAQELRDEAVCIVASYRDAELQAGGTLARTFARLVAEPNVRNLVMRGMGLSEVEECLTLALGSQPSPRAVEAVAARTEGNPFFVTQIGRQASRRRGGDLEAWLEEIPVTVKGMIESRLGRLSASARQVMSAAAVTGRTGTASALATICDLPQPAVHDGIAEAIRLGIVAPLPRQPGAFVFVHTLVRETVASGLLAAESAALHRRVLAALAPMAGERGAPSVSELAEHAWQAARSGEVADLVAAADWAVRAAELATSQLAFEAAAQQYERAIEAAAQLRDDPGRRVELQLLLGEAQGRSGDMATGQATLLRAAEAARQIGRGDLLARAALTYRIGGLAGFQFDDPDPRLRTLLEEGLASTADDDSPLRARLLMRLAVELHFTHEDGRRARLSDDAVAMARRLGEARLLAEALGARHIALWRPESVIDQLAAATEVCRIARDLGDRELELQGEYWRLCDLLELGDAVAVDESLETAARLAGELDQPLYTWWAVSRRAMRLLLAGEFREAQVCMEEQLAQGIRLKRSNAVQQYGGQLLLLNMEVGTAHEMVDAIEALVRDFPRDPTWRIVHAWLLGHIGRRERARAELDALAQAGFPLGHGFTRMICMALLCEVVADVAAEPYAERVHAALEPFAERAATAGTATICYGPAALPLARVSVLLGELDRAQREFETALRVSEALRSRPCAARTEVAYAEMLERRGRPGDVEAGVTRATAALAIARELGMPVLARRAEALLARLRPRAAAPVRREPAPLTGWDALTQRERAVVRLAVEGLQARAIGERLFIGRRTVETHLANAYGKLGVSSRVELVRAAVPEGSDP